MTTKHQALELADERESINFFDNPNPDPAEWAIKAEEMLRTIPALEAEIEALKSNAESMNQTNAAMGKRLLDLQAEIESLKSGGEPVAIRYDFDGYGYKYIDSGSGSDWQNRVVGEALYTHPAEPKELTVPENSQDWKGMDGATAFWLIERHSNHWDDARLMMEEWLKANTHPAKILTDEEVNIWVSENMDKYYFKVDGGDLRFNAYMFANALLKKASEQ